MPQPTQFWSITHRIGRVGEARFNSQAGDTIQFMYSQSTVLQLSVEEV